MGKFFKFLYISAIIILISVSSALAQEDIDPFAWNDSQTINAGELGEPTGDSATDDLLLPAMGDASKREEGIEQKGQKEGVEAKILQETPTPPSKQEEMLKAPMTVEEKAKTKEEIEKDIAALYKEGKKYYDIEDYEGAIQIWERIIQNYPTARNIYDIRYSLANAYEFNRQYDKAIGQYQKVLAEKPKYALATEAAYRLAGCYGKLGKWQYAIEIYRDMVRRGPGDKETLRAYFNMATIYFRQEKYKRAINIYKNVIKYYPSTPWEIQARFQLASTYGQINSYKSAIKEYKIIKYKFKDTEWAPRAAMHIGDVYKLSGDYKRAKEAYSRVIYEYYRHERYVQQAEERIKNLKYQRQLENLVNE